MQCLTDTGTAFVIADPQPTEYTTCTYILASPTDFSGSAFNITPAEGAQLSAAIVAVWALGFLARPMVKAISIDDKE